MDIKYKLFGVWKTDIHLFGVPSGTDKQGVFLLGTDRLGRDMFSRVSYGARLSLSMGMISVFLSLLLGRCPGRASPAISVGKSMSSFSASSSSSARYPPFPSI